MPIRNTQRENANEAHISICPFCGCLVKRAVGCTHIESESKGSDAVFTKQVIGTGESTIEHSAEDPFAQTVIRLFETGIVTVETFWGEPFAEPAHFTLAPTRSLFDAAFPSEWGITKTECWMVGVGVADFMAMLSPAAWKDEACEHDPDDKGHIRDIITHELAHVYHGQINPTRDFTGTEEIGWFVEGIGVLVAEQLNTERLSDPREAIIAGAAPSKLSSAWSGKYRYGVSGSLVAYIDKHYGRNTLFELLSVTSQEELLTVLNMTEEELLVSWREWVMRQE